MNVLEQWFDEVWNKRNVRAIDEMWIPQKKVHTLALGETDVKTKDEFKRFHRLFVTAYPDMHVEVEDVVEAGDKIAVRLRVTGTHTGAGFTDPPTGKAVDFAGMVIAHIENGKLVESWNSFDFLTMYKQLNVAQISATE